MEFFDDIPRAIDDLNIAIVLFRLQKLDNFELKAKLKIRKLENK